MVIGAGPAGSVAARELACRGASVLLVDRAAFPRTKVCGCCLNGAALAALESIGLGHIPAACSAVPLHTLQLAARGSSAELRMPAGAAVSREAFDAALVKVAEAASATFLPETTAKLDSRADVPRMEPDAQAREATLPLLAHRAPSADNYISIRLDGTGTSTRISARIVVLATGLSNNDSKPRSGSRLGGGIVVPCELAPSFFSPGSIYMATGRGGYVGLVRLEDDRLDVAAAFDPAFVKSSGGLGPAAAAILARTGWPTIPGLDELPWKGTPALTRHRSRVAEPRLFAVGDAASYVEPFTGDGMAWAIASASALAPIAHRAIQSWDESCIHEWQQAHARIVRRRQVICRIAARVLRSPWLTGVAVRVLALLPILSCPVVAALNRPVPSQGQYS